MQNQKLAQNQSITINFKFEQVKLIHNIVKNQLFAKPDKLVEEQSITINCKFVIERTSEANTTREIQSVKILPLRWILLFLKFKHEAQKHDKLSTI